MEKTAEISQTDHLRGNKNLLILTSVDSDNFSGTPPKTGTEIMIHQDTPVTKTV
jgi:hypothetical protein